MRLAITKIAKYGLAAAVALTGLAGSASAQTLCDFDITAATPVGPVAGCDRIWGDEPDEAYIVVDGPVFVLDTRLTVLPGTIIRGNPRHIPFDPLDPTLGFPGTLIIPRGSFLDARGTPGSPIIFTTAAVDNDNDGIADDVSPANGEPDAWAPGDLFLDDTPVSNPLSTLLSDGTQAYGYHGGLVVMGYAPTNLDAGVTGVTGEGSCEGLPVPGVAPAAAVFGGQSPHDSSGAIEYFSVRHAGEEIAPNDELNGVTLCGVGDGTIISHAESYANGDDGFEMFGGTVNLNNVIVAYAGDDAIDTDQGYTGQLQNVLTLSMFFNEDGGGSVGTGGSGDAAGEIDGEDCPSCITDAVDGFVVPQPQFVACNWTHVGNVEAGMNGGITNPAVSPNSDNEGIQMDTQATPIICNSLILGMTGGSQPNIEHDASGRPGIGQIVATTGDFTFDAGATIFATAGDAAVAAGTEYIGGTPNITSSAAQLLVNENHYFLPKGVAVSGRGKLLGAKTTDAGVAGGPAFNPRPATPAAAEVSGGIEPHWAGMDRSATYRGAFPDSADLWAEPWSTLSLGGIID